MNKILLTPKPDTDEIFCVCGKPFAENEMNVISDNKYGVIIELTHCVKKTIYLDKINNKRITITNKIK